MFRQNVIAMLGLIFSLQSCVSYEQLSESGKLQKGMSKGALEQVVMFANAFQHPFHISATREYYEAKKLEIIAPATNSQAFVFLGVSDPSDPPLVCLELVCDLNVGDGRLDSWHPNLETAKAYATNKFGVSSGSTTKIAKTDEPIVRPQQNIRRDQAGKKEQTASMTSSVRPRLVMDMWEELKKSQNPNTLYLIGLRCHALTRWYEENSILEEWGIDGDQIEEWYYELAYLRWPKSTWESPLEPPEAWIEEMAQSANNHFRYGLYLTRLEENKGPNYVGRFMAYMETNEKELNLCAQIAKNY